MNIKSKLTLVLSLVAVPLALPATIAAEDYLESYHAANAHPVPTSIVIPNVPAEFAGKEFSLKFVVDPSGKPTHIASATPGTNPRLVASLSDAVTWWKFTPAYRNGKPVACNVELPVVVRTIAPWPIY